MSKQANHKSRTSWSSRTGVPSLLVLCLSTMLATPLTAQQPNANFSRLLEGQMLQVFTRVCNYVEEHPDADDVDSAYQWIFKTALKHHFQTKALVLAQRYLQRPKQVASIHKLAQQILILGKSQQGEMAKAQAGFQQFLKEQPAYTAEENISFALQFASQAQLQKQYRIAAGIYADTARRFTLNPQVREICENKIAKLQLINETAPPIAALDIARKRVDISSYRGKVLLIDFWATNCPPCVEALPHMKRLYKQYHAQGLEILGISLDIHQETVSKFQQERKIPWQLMMLEASPGSLRRPYKVRAIPSLYLVNRQGKIVQFDLSGHDLSQAIAQLMKHQTDPDDETSN